MAVTLVSAWLPARRAGAVHPVHAMRSGDQSSTQPVGTRSSIGGILLVAGLATTATAAFMMGWSTTSRAVFTGLGALALNVGVLLHLEVVAGELGLVWGIPWRSLTFTAAGAEQILPDRGR